MRRILFATNNERKVVEANAACMDFEIEVVQIKLLLDEIQSRDPIIISTDKAEKAFAMTNKPVVVTDTFWNIPALRGFPGAYMKDVNEWFGTSDFLNLMKDKADRRISFTESVTYKDLMEIKIFSKEFWGDFAESPRGSGNPIEQLAKFNGETIGEKRDKGNLSHDPKEYVWFDFAKWFIEKK